MSQSLDQEQARQQYEDRISGILVGAACGDALGAGCEFGPALDPSTPIYMCGQGAFAAGEWTDDTAQMIAIALAAEKYDINIYTAITRASDLVILVGTETQMLDIFGEKHLKKLEKRQESN